MTGPADPELPDAPDGLAVFDAPPIVPGTDRPLAYGEEPPSDARVAHPAVRALAFFLDGFATTVLVIGIVFVGLVADAGLAFWAIPLVPLGAAVLDTVLTALRGITPGKALFGLRVVDVASGAPIGIGRAVLRSLVIVAPMIIAIALGYATAYLPYAVREVLGEGAALVLFVPLAGWIALLVVLAIAPRHRGLQDRAGRSIVVRP